MKYAARQPQYSIVKSTYVSKNTVKKILRGLVERIPAPDFSLNKLGGRDKVVQIDETMLNFKVKSHRGRAPSNITDSLCMMEYTNRITMCFARIIPDKKEATIVPIICS